MLRLAQLKTARRVDTYVKTYYRKLNAYESTKSKRRLLGLSVLSCSFAMEK